MIPNYSKVLSQNRCQTLQISSLIKKNPSHPGSGVLTDELLARPPLTVRAKELIPIRRRKEAYYRPNRRDKDENSPVIWWRGIGMGMLRIFLKGVGLYEKGRKNALDFQMVHLEFLFDTLPSTFEGFRILQLSDLHLPRCFPEFAACAGAFLNGLEVDLCVLNGDYRWGYYGPVDHVPVQLAQLLGGVRCVYGTVACPGNHDTLITAEVLEAAGIPVLFNEGFLIQHDGAAFWICGIDDPHVYTCDRIDQAVRGAPKDAIKILIAHTPERIEEAAKADISLYLTGHTHGGQIRLPWVGAVTKNASCRREYILGKWQYRQMHGYTTAGLGTTDLPVRFNCPPEAVLITLRPSTSRSRKE